MSLGHRSCLIHLLAQGWLIHFYNEWFHSPLFMSSFICVTRPFSGKRCKNWLLWKIIQPRPKLCPYRHQLVGCIPHPTLPTLTLQFKNTKSPLFHFFITYAESMNYWGLLSVYQRPHFLRTASERPLKTAPPKNVLKYHPIRPAPKRRHKHGPLCKKALKLAPKCQKRGLLRWPKKDDRNRPCEMTKFLLG